MKTPVLCHGDSTNMEMLEISTIAAIRHHGFNDQLNLLDLANLQSPLRSAITRKPSLNRISINIR